MLYPLSYEGILKRLFVLDKKNPRYDHPLGWKGENKFSPYTGHSETYLSSPVDDRNSGFVNDLASLSGLTPMYLNCSSHKLYIQVKLSTFSTFLTKRANMAIQWAVDNYT